MKTTRPLHSKLRPFGWCVVLLPLILTACGGDGGNGSTPTPVNQPPTFSNFETPLSVNENQTDAVTVSASDPEGASLTYSLTGTDRASLSISSSGVITFDSAPDYETKTSYAITVNVRDGINTTSQALVINITNVNDNDPVISDLASSVSVAENQTSVVTVSAADADGDSLAYTITGTDEASLSISSSGVITFDSAPDYETKTSYAITVNVSDGTNTTSQALVIDITNVNDNNPEAVGENHDVYAGSYILRQLSGIDADNDPLFYELVSHTQNGVLTLADNGIFTYRPNEGFIGADNFNFQVSDPLEIPSTAEITIDSREAPAGAILDLRANGLTPDELSLIWTAIDVDGLSNDTASYDIRYGSQVLTEDNWQEASILDHNIIPAAAGELEELLASDLEQDSIYFFAIRQVDDEGASSPLSNVLYAKTGPAPFLSIDTSDAGPLSVEQNQNQQQSFTISNDGLLDLYFNMEEILSAPITNSVLRDPQPLNYLELSKGQLDDRRGDIVEQGIGGPDNFGYEWIDSNEAGGPPFDWTDISSTGTEVRNLTDDNVVGPFPIGFPFLFYGKTQNTFFISSNGFITFSDASSNGCCAGQPIPQTDSVNHMIAWLWRDLHPRNGQVFYQVLSNQRLIIQFNDYGEYGYPGKVDAQVILYANGDIKLQYHRLESGIDQRSGSIGIENANGSDGLQVAFNTAYLEEELAIQLSAIHIPTWVTVSETEGWIAPGQTQDISLEFRANVWPGDHAATVFLRHNSVYQDPVEIPLSLQVTDDITAPPAIDSLSASQLSSDRMLLNWQAVADAGIVAPDLASYETRYSLTPIDESNWDSAIPIANTLIPAVAGSAENLWVTGLTAETLYHFAIKGVDQAGNISALSNVLSISTLGPAVVDIPVDNIVVELREGRTTTTPFAIANTGESELTYSITLQEIEQEIAATAARRKTALHLLQSRKSRVISELPRPGSYLSNEVVIRFKPQAEANDLQSILYLQHNARLINRIDTLNMQVWRVNDESTLLETIQTLNQRPDVVFAEPNYTLIANAFPDDARFEELWGLHNRGETGGTIDADIDAVEAWDISTGNSDIVVAVIDTGIDYTHPDLAENMWVNQDEIAGNGIDDDNNGFVDDIYGFDFANDDGDPFDDQGHGTHVAGTVGAVGNNGQGVVGVNHQVALMGVKFLSSDGGGTTSDAVDSIIYAVDNGADILSNSWGGGGFSESLRTAIEYAHQNDVLFVAAAGNSGTDNDIVPSYPASYEVDNVVAVAATDRNDQMAAFSQYGEESVDLGAPGVDILSSVPNGGYSSFSGTSMATPHVSGAAALLKAHLASLSSIKIKQILLDSSDPLSSLESLTVSGGRLNVLEALRMAGPSWISLPPQSFSGTVAPGEESELTLDIDSTDLEPGTHVVEIVLRTNDPVTPEVTALVTVVVLPDIEAPSPITDLVVTDITDTRARVIFTATGDDGLQGQAQQYDLRYSINFLDEDNWEDATSASGMVTPGAAGSPESFVVSSLIANSTLWIGVRAIDNVGLISDLSNVVQITTLNAELELTPEEIPPTITSPGETHEIFLTLRNIGQVDLNIVANVAPNNASSSLTTTRYLASRDLAKDETDYRVGPPIILGSGGPDEFGYVWTDSNESGGPSFTWTDISTTGTLISDFSDDNVVGPIDIEFPFPFYGQEQDQLFLSSNGFISFDSDIGNGCCAGQPIPSEDAYNHLIAWMWDDLHPQNGTVHYEHFDDDSVVIQFTDYGEYGDYGTVDAQVQLNASGEVILRYKEFSDNMDKDSASIGIENRDGDDGLQVAFNTTYLEDELAISLVPHWLSSDTSELTLSPSAEATIVLTINTQNLAVGDYESHFVINSNDATRPQIVLPVSLEIAP